MRMLLIYIYKKMNKKIMYLYSQKCMSHYEEEELDDFENGIRIR